MHTAISCATCNRPLRIASELLGQTVRCPFCTDAFVAVANPALKLEEAVVNKADLQGEQPAREPGVALLEPEPPVVEESFTVDFAGPAKPPPPPRPWETRVFIRKDSDRRLWGEMQAEISSEGVRLYRGRKELIVPVGCEATWVSGGLVRVTVGSRTVEFQIKKKHVYKAWLAADVAGFLNGDRPMPVNKGYGWPWYQWLMLLAPLGLLAVLIIGELPETDLKPLKGFGIFLLAVLGPVLAYALWNAERLPIRLRWASSGLVVGAAYVLSVSMYFFGPNLPPAAATARWFTFTNGLGPGTSVSMPAAPLQESAVVNNAFFIKYSARVKPNQTFIIAYADLPGDFNNPWGVETAFNYGRQFLSTEYPRSLAAGEHALDLDGLPGKEMTFSLGRGRGGFTMTTARMYLVGNRLYLLLTSDTVGMNGSKFLDSFRVSQVEQKNLPSPKEFPGLTAYWSFDVENGGIVREDTGHFPQPVALNNCRLANGIRGKGLEMTGVPGSHFEYGGGGLALNFTAKEPFTFAGWFKTSRFDTTLVAQRNNLDAEGRVCVRIVQGQLIGEVHRNGNPGLNAAVVASRFGNVADNKWHHFALVRDATGLVDLYFDGDAQGAQAVPGATGPITTNLRALGSDLYEQQNGGGGPQTAFTGSMDEFCIFHRRLSQEEINRLAGKP